LHTICAVAVVVVITPLQRDERRREHVVYSFLGFIIVGCASNNNNMPSKARTTRGPETDAPFIEVSCQKEREHNIQPGIAGKLERERERARGRGR